MQVAILVVSDRASKDVRFDESGPAIEELLYQQHYPSPIRTVVPDEEPDIQMAVSSWCQRGDIDWIITTGGTGFGVRDKTPEAIRPLLDREAPGLVHLILSKSLSYTPLAALSRPVAGTIGKTLVVTLPGSVKAVRENLAALLSGGVVEHAIDLIRGGSGERVHSAMASSLSPEVPADSSDRKGKHHHHHHHRHDGRDEGRLLGAFQPQTIPSHELSLPASARPRVSPYRLFSFEDALNIIFNEIKPLEIIELPVTYTLKGHVLAEDVHAHRDVPLSPTTNVDGYALRSTEDPGIYKVLTSKTHHLSQWVPEGCIYRINTGGPLPAGTDAVIMVEDTRLVTTVKGFDGEDIEEDTVETLLQVSAGENVRAAGSDVRNGDIVLGRGDVIQSVGGEIGALAFIGRQQVNVYKKPVVALLSTGNELVDLHDRVDMPDDGWGGIWDTNRPSLHTALDAMGYEVVDIGIVPDDTNSHVAAITKALAHADLLLTTGGTSMGATDLLKPVIENRFGGLIHFGRVAVRPGKPTTFASIPYIQDGRETTKYVFGLPGNPASALVTFHVFVVPALRQLGGWPAKRCQLPRVEVTIQDEMNLDSRVEFHRVVIRAEADGLKAYSTGGQRSSRVASLSGGNGLVVLPTRKADGPEKARAGQRLQAVLLGEIQ